MGQWKTYQRSVALILQGWVCDNWGESDAEQPQMHHTLGMHFHSGATTMPDIFVWQDSHKLSFKSSCLCLVAKAHFNAVGICGFNSTSGPETSQRSQLQRCVYWDIRLHIKALVFPVVDIPRSLRLLDKTEASGYLYRSSLWWERGRRHFA